MLLEELKVQKDKGEEHMFSDEDNVPLSDGELALLSDEGRNEYLHEERLKSEGQRVGSASAAFEQSISAPSVCKSTPCYILALDDLFARAASSEKVQFVQSVGRSLGM